MNKSTRLTVLGGVALILSSYASAATMTVNCSTLDAQTELNSTVSCARFDIAGATLTGMSLNVAGTVSGTVTLTNNSSTSQSASATSTSEFYWGPLAGFTFLNPAFTAAYTTGTVTIGCCGASQSYSGLAGNNSASQTNSGVYAPYTGAGNFNIAVSTLTGLGVKGGGGNIVASQTTRAIATATVTYTYNTVPEPGTYMLMGLGVTVLGLVRRRRA